MDTLSRIRLAKIISKVLEALSQILVGIALAVAALSFLSFVSSVDPGSLTAGEFISALISEPLVNNIIIKPFIILLASFVISIIGKLVSNLASDLEKEIKKIILGIITTMRVVDLSSIAEKTGMSVNQLEQYLAQLAHDGEFKGTIKDGKVYAFVETTHTPAPLPYQPPHSHDNTLVDVSRLESSVEGTIVVDTHSDNKVIKKVSSQSVDNAEVDKDLLNILLNGDIDSLEKLYKEGRIDEDTFKEALGLIEARREGILSEEAFMVAARNLVEKIS